MTESQQKYLKERAETIRRSKGRVFIPGHTKGQPYKEDYKRWCYQITKPLSAAHSKWGDRFDHFLSEADQKINYY